jgi:hypothetical protein
MRDSLRIEVQFPWILAALTGKIRALRPSLATSHGPLIAISSPYAPGVASCGKPLVSIMAKTDKSLLLRLLRGL